ncbi:Heat shock protein [Nesidiocoris tenuis]|nr:Heat shock protein [Nesidiocoris tenuis]
MNETYDRMKARIERLKHSASQLDKNGDKEHRIYLDVQNFQPEDLRVALFNGYIQVTATHPERKDEHGWVQRSFSRKLQIPDNLSPDSIESHLSSDGVLTITVADKKAKAAEKEYDIPILVEGRRKLFYR